MFLMYGFLPIYAEKSVMWPFDRCAVWLGVRARAYVPLKTYITNHSASDMAVCALCTCRNAIGTHATHSAHKYVN